MQIRLWIFLNTLPLILAPSLLLVASNVYRRDSVLEFVSFLHPCFHSQMEMCLKMADLGCRYEVHSYRPHLSHMEPLWFIVYSASEWSMSISQSYVLFSSVMFCVSKLHRASSRLLNLWWSTCAGRTTSISTKCTVFVFWYDIHISISVISIPSCRCSHSWEIMIIRSSILEVCWKNVVEMRWIILRMWVGEREKEMTSSVAGEWLTWRRGDWWDQVQFDGKWWRDKKKKKWKE